MALALNLKLQALWAGSSAEAVGQLTAAQMQSPQNHFHLLQTLYASMKSSVDLMSIYCEMRILTSKKGILWQATSKSSACLFFWIQGTVLPLFQAAVSNWRALYPLIRC